jgi:hypothetical protein
MKTALDDIVWIGSISPNYDSFFDFMWIWVVWISGTPIRNKNSAFATGGGFL